MITYLSAQAKLIYQTDPYSSKGEDLGLKLVEYWAR